MAVFVATDGFVSVNSVDLSNHVKKFSLDYKAAAEDTTAMGNTTHIRQGGLFDWTLTIEFEQDFAAASVDATLFSLVGTTFAVDVRAVRTGGRSVTNPNFTGTGFLSDYKPADLSIGTLVMAPVTIVAAGTLSRLTA